MLMSFCVHVVKMCVSKEWNLHYNSSRTHVIGPGTQVAAALFDVGGRFEALSEHTSGGRRFFLVAHTDTDNPI